MKLIVIGLSVVCRLLLCDLRFEGMQHEGEVIYGGSALGTLVFRGDGKDD